ncbi:putative AAA family ATPase [Usnea florida]
MPQHAQGDRPQQWESSPLQDTTEDTEKPSSPPSIITRPKVYDASDPTTTPWVDCPICSQQVKEANINSHIDSDCKSFVDEQNAAESIQDGTPQVASFFRTPSSKKSAPIVLNTKAPSLELPTSNKRPPPSPHLDLENDSRPSQIPTTHPDDPPAKRSKSNALQRAAPLAERMRPRTLDDVFGQDLVNDTGVLRGLIESDRVPSMILWGSAGTGKTTIARVIANMVGSRFVEINSTSSGVAECKKLFAEAKGELGLTGRKTIIFCDEIHRFSKSQQDVFLGPVEAGTVTLIGATTENPSFKVQNALLSRCRTFTLSKLKEEDIMAILKRALETEGPSYKPSDLIDEELIRYLASFADGDARTALNLFELAMDLSQRASASQESIKASLTKTLVYDRSGDQHYDTISAFHKSVRGSDPHATLYYLARMIQSGEDALYIARRMVVIASEDIGLADNSMLALATSTYTAAEKIGLPEARINLAHCAVALALSPKSTRAYRGLGNAMASLKEPGVAGLPIPIHLRNAPTRLMKEMGYGAEYKYNPRFVDGRVKQEYLPQELRDSVFLEDRDLGTEVDEDLVDGD